MNFARKILFTSAVALLAASAAPAMADHHTNDMPKNIVEKAASLDDFSTLVTAVKAAELVGVLSGDGPFTVFAPTNAAFDKLPDGTVGTLVQPENKALLQKILTYHVVSGTISAKIILEAIQAGGGSTTLTTVQGGTLTASLSDDGAVILTDETGGQSTVTATDINQSNGVIHVIDTVVMPS